MKNLLLTGVAAAGLLVLAGTGTSQAGAATGAVWETTTTNAMSTTIPGGAPTATFVPGAINYNPSDDSGVYTIGAFLNNPTFLTGGSAAGDSMLATVFQFTGTVGLNHGLNSFVVGHDDGVVLTIAGFGTVVNEPGPTALDTTPFTVDNPGAAGNFAFTLNYAECCGPPASLVFAINDVPVGAPEPATMAIIGTGLAGIGFLRRRKRI
jgi:hypothetical protein